MLYQPVSRGLSDLPVTSLVVDLSFSVPPSSVEGGHRKQSLLGHYRHVQAENPRKSPPHTIKYQETFSRVPAKSMQQLGAASNKYRSSPSNISTPADKATESPGLFYEASETWVYAARSSTRGYDRKLSFLSSGAGMEDVDNWTTGQCSSQDGSQ